MTVINLQMQLFNLSKRLQPLTKRTVMSCCTTPFSLIKENRTEEAIEILEQLGNRKSNVLEGKEQWYLGLALLKVNDIDKTKQVFENMLEQKNTYNKSKVQQILKSIS